RVRLACAGGADLPARLPHVPGLRPFSTPDGHWSGIAPPAGAVWRLRRRGSRWHSWDVSLRTGACSCAGFLLPASQVPGGRACAASGNRGGHMRRAAWLAALATSAFAHMMSMSSGDLSIRGTHAVYELRMPLYEIPHVKDPAETLFRNIHFSSSGH